MNAKTLLMAAVLAVVSVSAVATGAGIVRGIEMRRDLVAAEPAGAGDVFFAGR